MKRDVAHRGIGRPGDASLQQELGGSLIIGFQLERVGVLQLSQAITVEAKRLRDLAAQLAAPLVARRDQPLQEIDHRFDRRTVRRPAAPPGHD